MLHKLRRAMVAPDRSLLSEMVEADETEVPFRTKSDDHLLDGRGRSHVGKMLVIGAVELLDGGRPGQIRLEPLTDFSASAIKRFIERTVERGATVVSDGWAGYNSLTEYKRHAKIVGKMAAHIVLPWIHRVFANFKRWALGTYHGLRKAHLQRYLDEFVFRWNRRRYVRGAFDTLLGLTARLGHAFYRDLIGQTA